VIIFYLKKRILALAVNFLKGVSSLNRRPGSVVAFTMLVAVLVLSMVPDVFAATWLIYDDDDPEFSTCHSAGYYQAVRFSLPDGWPQAKITKISYFIHEETLTPFGPFNAYIFDSDGSTILLGPLSVTPTSDDSWLIIDVSSYDIWVSGDFYVAIYFITTCVPHIAFDMTPPIDQRSYAGNTLPLIGPDTGLDYLIRAEVDPGRIRPSSSVVGGFYAPKNYFAVLLPYLTLVSLACVVSAILVIRKKRKS